MNELPFPVVEEAGILVERRTPDPLWYQWWQATGWQIVAARQPWIFYINPS
jgi:hypothetical protein